MDESACESVPETAALAIDLGAAATASYAMHQNAVPVVHFLRVRNEGASALEGIVTRIAADPGFATPWERTVARISPGETYDLGLVDLVLDHTYLSGLTERVAGSLQVTVAHGDEVLAAVESRIEVLARDEWGGISGLPELLAAFVVPNDPGVERLLSEASAILGRDTGSSALSGYQEASKSRVLETASAIYAAIHNAGIRYVAPPASFERGGQKIRLPGRVLENLLGTCLDLAVLAAACLEQAGLHPLVVLVQDHAFCGVWLEEESFADAAMDDGLQLRKRVEVGDVCVFDAVAATADHAVSLERAIQGGRGYLEDLSRFEYAIDVARARRARVLPIPSGSAPADAAGEATGGGRAPLGIGQVDGLVPSGPPTADETPATRLTKWKRKLLDLTMRNNLLSLPDTRTVLPLCCPNLAALEDALADGRVFQVLPLPADGLATGGRSTEVIRERTGEDALAGMLAEELRGDRLYSALPEGEVLRRLTEIYRRQRTALEEGGTNTLHLALGVLEYREVATSGRTRRAPLLLVPLIIERPSAREQCRLRLGDEEPVVNATLLEYLQRDHGITVPGVEQLPSDEHGVDLPAVLQAFRRAVRDVRGWQVVEEAAIGHFSFTKFLMWHDLEARTDDLMASPVVRHLIETPNEPFGGATGGFAKAEELDDDLRPQDALCPMDADSSQLTAVRAAVEGRSFVLHGPPGTGKSQSITNMIAGALARGKSVLFVSEKMAALGVVQRRLGQCGLGPFCLELHSNKSRSQDVLDQLGAALGQRGARSSDEWEREALRVAALRTELNGYVRALHAPRSNGLTLFRAHARLSTLREVPEVPLGWPVSDATTGREALERAEAAAKRVAHADDFVSFPLNSVWGPCRAKEWSSAWRDGVEAALGEAHRARASLGEGWRQVAEVLAIDAEATEEQLRTVPAVLAALRAGSLSAGMLAAPDWRWCESALGALSTRVTSLQALRAELAPHFDEAVAGLELSALSDRLATGEKAWLLARSAARKAVARELRPYARSEGSLKPETMAWALTHSQRLREETAQLAAMEGDASALLGPSWRDLLLDPTAVDVLRKAVGDLRDLAARVAGHDQAVAVRLRCRWASLLAPGGDRVPEGDTAAALGEWVGRAERYFHALAAVESALSLDRTDAWGRAATPGHLGRVSARLDEWRPRLSDLRDWCDWQRVRQAATEAGLASLVSALESGVLTPDSVPRAFERAYLRWWAELTSDGEPALREFRSREFERRIAQFAETDRRYTQLTRYEICARLSARVPEIGSDANAQSEAGVLARERQKRTRHLAVRSLCRKLPTLLRRLKPCLLMSPLSVAQYLDPAQPPFDIVVFDEASQIPPWDAIGAIARGREVVIVGDPKQLPPTSFFQRAEGEGEPDETVVEDLESILDECIAARLPELRLRWHYRSRHESLIAFSNRYYYENSLLAFPSPHRELGVRFRYVAGTYDRSASRTNRAEANAVVAEVVARLRDPARNRHSIGVVTFSAAQQTLVEDLLDEARRRDPQLEPYFASESAPENEPVFVKNLESVQGDERDVILLSICYGPDANGRISMNFGPLNREGGERRLNVAITRARREVHVFSSLRADQIDLSRTQALASAHLKLFLDYAERGEVALAAASSVDPEAEEESPLEREIATALRGRGYRVQPQVGCAGYRVDLGIVDDEREGRYLLGVECDGASYHSFRTARDRDRLRSEVLTGLGWRLHRVWSTDWWEDPERELERIDAAIEAARHARPEPAPRPLHESSSDPSASGEGPSVYASAPALQATGGLPPYRVVHVGLRGGCLTDFQQATSSARIVQAIEAVARHEGPIGQELAWRRVAGFWSVDRMDAKVKVRLDQLTRRSDVRIVRHGERTFLWSPEVDRSTWRGFRASTPDQRGADDLAPEEVSCAAAHALDAQGCMPRQALIQETARLFGFQRVGARVLRAMDEGIDLLLRRGEAEEAPDGLIAPTANRVH